MTELEKAYYVRTDKRIEQFIENIPFNELYDYIRKIIDVPDLKFNMTIKEGRNGLYPMIESEDITEYIGVMKFAFSEMTIGTFNSSVSVNTPKDYNDMDYTQDYPLDYWCTIHFSYRHYGGGTNGADFLTAWYDDKSGWTFRLEKDRG